MTILTSNS